MSQSTGAAALVETTWVTQRWIMPMWPARSRTVHPGHDGTGASIDCPTAAANAVVSRPMAS